MVLAGANDSGIQRFFSPSSESLEKRFKDWYHVRDAFEKVVISLKDLKEMDRFGCADRWPQFVVESVEEAFNALVALCNDIDNCMEQGQDMEGASRSDGGSIEDALLDDLFADLLMRLLQRRAMTIFKGNIESDEMRSGIAEALKSAFVIGERFSLGFTFDSDDGGGSDECVTEVRAYGRTDPIVTASGESLYSSPWEKSGRIEDSAWRSQESDELADDEKTNQE